MRTLRRWIHRLTSWATIRRDEERLRAEIEEHLALACAEHLRGGHSPAEARRLAALEFGGVEAIKDTYREQRGLPGLETLLQDTRHALRRLRRAPAFTAATVLTLAMGIGATTAIFSLVHAVLMKSLPVAKPEELYRLGKESHCCYQGGYSQEGGFSLVSYDLYQYLRDHTTGFSELAAFPSLQLSFGVRRSGSPETAQTYPGEFVSGNYFAMFGVNAYTGRTFTSQDDRPGAPPVAVMSHRLWQQRYGSDPAVVGSVFQVNDRPVTVIGVAPPGFFGDTLRGTPPDFFLPLHAEPVLQSDSDLNKYDIHWLQLIGRVRPGISAQSVEAELRVALQQWLSAHWNEMSASDRAKLPAQTLFLTPGGSGITSMREQYERWLQILMAITAFVLLIVCANVANLMLVRGLERRKQVSLSMALGARTMRLVRQPLLECILLAFFGGLAGVGIAFAGTRLILNFAFPRIPGLAGVPIDTSPSLPVLLFAFAVSLVTGGAFGLAPAWMATRVDPMEVLRGNARSTARAGLLPRKALVVLQAALSLVLLSSAGLLTTTFESLTGQDFGFAQDRRLVMAMNPRLAGYRAPQLPQLYRRIHDALANVPGVAGVALCLYSPQKGGGWGSGVWVDGQPAPGPREEPFSAWERVSDGYFDVIGTPILRGRGITGEDTSRSRKVAVVSEMFARRFFRNQDPIGKHFGRTPNAAREFEVVGVAKDARYLTYNQSQSIRPMFYLAETQAEYDQTNLGSLFLGDIVIEANSGEPPSTPTLQQAMASVDPNLPVISVRPLREQVAGQFTQQRLIARLTSFFGLLSLVLASIGLYGVTAYHAGRSVAEIGVRMALGADRYAIVRFVLRGAFLLIIWGLAMGLPLSFAAARFVGTQLYGMSPYNPVVLTGAVMALALSGLVASLAPALRASMISPLDALRSE